LIATHFEKLTEMIINKDSRYRDLGMNGHDLLYTQQRYLASLRLIIKNPASLCLASVQDEAKRGASSKIRFVSGSDVNNILFSGKVVPAEESYIASNVHGYNPGPCCTKDEINTITVHQQMKWNQSDLSIRYI
jgi:hypothetical protein